MRVVVSFPGTLMDAQQAARAFYERQALAVFVTGLGFHEKTLLRLEKYLGERITKELQRRAITEVPSNLIFYHPWLEPFRTALSRCVKNPIYADMVWDALSHRFDDTVGRRHLDGVQAVYAFEYAAKATFEQAGRRRIAKILALPSTDNKEFEDIKNREESRFPELRSSQHRYFAQRFATRYERRCTEIGLADVIVVNSEMTRRSHIRAGANPGKIVAVPLGAPPVIESIAKPVADIDRPLSVVWAGNITIGKGAHYFLDSWRALNPGRGAYAQVYGRIGLPERVLRPLPQGIDLMGSVPQVQLFAAFEKADVLVFPTLGDGFGMVVTEAFSRGLPVITTDKAGASQLVEHGRNGMIIPAADATALAEALRRCLDNRKALYQMRFHALETARRWQWSDYRRLLIAKVAEGLRRAGYAAEFGPEAVTPDSSTCPGSFAFAL
jgi:glycosyltransferase involved in cell wall biosynthesis